MNTQKGKNYGLFAKPHATSDNNHLTVSGYGMFYELKNIQNFNI